MLYCLVIAPVKLVGLSKFRGEPRSDGAGGGNATCATVLVLVTYGGGAPQTLPCPKRALPRVLVDGDIIFFTAHAALQHIEQVSSLFVATLEY